MNIIPPPEHSPSMQTALNQADTTRGAIISLTPNQYANDRLTVLTVAYTSQVLEHLEAILRLCNWRLPGSALALFRPLVETMLRCQWLRTCATSEQIDRFVSDPAFQLPAFKEIVDQLDAKNNLNGFFDGYKAAYQSMCEYTHSGYEQIVNRVSNTRIGPDYKDDLMVGLIRESEKVALFHAIFLCNAVGHPENARELSALAAELNVAT